MTVPVIPRGGLNAAKAQVEEKEARKSKGGSYNTWEYLTLAPPKEGEVYGESVVLRMVTDEPEWRETRQHSFCKTKPAPADKPADKKWPTHMGGVCRRSKGFDAIYSDCYICDAPEYQKKSEKTGKLYSPFPSLRLWAVAVVRKPVLGTPEMVAAGTIQKYEVGEPVSWEDETVEVDVWEDNEKTTKTIKKFVVLNFGMENFFDHLLGLVSVNNTVLDRDIKITRKGSGTDTTYNITGLDKIKVEVDGRMIPFDLRNEDFAKDYEMPFNLDEIIAQQASDEHYEWFFDRRVEASWEKRFGKKEEGESKPAVTNAAEDKAQADAAADVIAKMRDKYKK